MDVLQSAGLIAAVFLAGYLIAIDVITGKAI